MLGLLLGVVSGVDAALSVMVTMIGSWMIPDESDGMMVSRDGGPATMILPTPNAMCT